MKISVWDTYVERESGIMMHFDILVPSELTDEQSVFSFGTEYLKSKSFKTGKLSSNECRFCHIEQATENIISAIEKNGYSIIEMENCD